MASNQDRFLPAIGFLGLLHSAACGPDVPSGDDPEPEDPARVPSPPPQEPAIAETRVPPPTLEAIERAREELNSDGTRLRLLGLNNAVYVTEPTPGSSAWVGSADERVWQHRVVALDAKFIALTFGTFLVPEGVELRIHGIKSGAVEGPFISRDRNSYNGLFVAPMPDNEVLIELRANEGVALDDVDVTLSFVTYGLEEFLTPPSDFEDSSNEATGGTIDDLIQVAGSGLVTQSDAPGSGGVDGDLISIMRHVRERGGWCGSAGRLQASARRSEARELS